MAELGPLEWSGHDVDVTTLESRLNGLWHDLSRQAPHIHPVRTRIFNLVIYAGDRSAAETVIQQLKALRYIHPSRTIVLVSDRLHRTTCVDADLVLQCDGATPDRPGVCHERIVLTVCGRAADHLGSIVNPLLRAGLPTFLWWSGQPLFGHRVFHRLLEISDHLVVDSAQFDRPGDALGDLAHVCAGRQAVNDFNWARLTPWREIIAQFFDGPGLAPYVWGIRSIRVEFGRGEGDSGRATSSVLLLLGWMASLLGWEPETTLDRPLGEDITVTILQRDRVIPVDLVFGEYGSEAACKLMSLCISAEAPGCPPATFTVNRSQDLDHVHISSRVGEEAEVTRVVPLGLSSDADILTDELERTGKDLLYDQVVREASRMAGREVWTAV